MKANFNITAIQLKKLGTSFNELVALSNKATGNNVYRVDVFRTTLNRAIKVYNALKEDTNKTPYMVVVDVIGKAKNELIGEIIANQPLKDGESIAFEMRLSTSTGAVAYYIGKPLPFLPGAENMVKTLAKRTTKPGGAFAIETRKGDKVAITTYSVAERTEQVFKEDGTPETVTKKVATKATGWVRLYHPSEQSFKKGIVRGLQRIA